MISGNFIFFIIFIIFVISAIKRALENAAKEGRKPGAQGPAAGAGRSEIEEFLRSLQQARREQPGSEQPRVQPGQQAPAAPAVPPQARVEEGALLWQAPVARTIAVRRPAAPAVRPVRVRRQPKPADDEVVETLVATEPVKELPPPEPKPAVVTPPELKKVGLKEAVIWSEVLGPPLSVRRRSGRTRGFGPLGR